MRVVWVLLTAVMLALTVAAHAGAGTYTVVQCDASAADLNPTADDAEPYTHWAAYAVKDQCERPDEALKVNDIDSAQDGAYGAWRYLAPPGTRFSGLDVGVRLIKDAGHRPLLYGSNGTGASVEAIAQDTGDNGWRHKQWSASPGQGPSELGVRLKCTPPSGNECAESSTALAWMRNLRIGVNDSSAPVSLLDGSLLSPGWQSGTKSLAVSATDAGGGVRRIEVEANGATAAERVFDCETIPGTASVRRLQPCAPMEMASFDLDTSQAPFREGSNTIDVCVEAYGETSVNRTCSTRTVKIDSVGPGAPQNLTVAGGEGWRHVNDFDVSWENPEQPGGAAVEGAYYELADALGNTVTGPTFKSGSRIDHIDNLSVPDSGDYVIRIWLRDEAGNASEINFQGGHLRFDDVAPPPVTTLLPAGWLSRRELGAPYLQEWARPQAPVSGIAGYAIAIDSFPHTNPCETTVDPDPAVCTSAELARAATANSYPISGLPDGSGYFHIAAASGAGLRSSSVSHVELRVDTGDPVTGLLGAPTGWTSQPVTLVVHATDELSGMQPVSGDDGRPRTALEVDGGGVLSDPDNEVTYTLADEGDHEVRYWARDLAGNENDGDPGTPGSPVNNQPAVARVKIDLTPPNLAFGARDPADPEFVRVAVNDALSGLDSGHINFRPQGASTWQPLATAISGDSLEARFPSEQVPDGTYQLQAEATDRAGNATTTTSRADGSEMQLEVPLKTETDLGAKFGTGGHRRTVGYGHPAKVAGRLLDAAGHPVVGEPVKVTERFDEGSNADEHARTAETGVDGRFSLRLAPGTSRKVDVEYAGSRRFTAANPDLLRLDVSGAARFTTSSRRVRVGEHFRFAGKVKHLGARLPSSGKLVELQVHRPEGWDTVRQAFHTQPDGHWRFPFKFGNYYVQPTRFRFRLKVGAEAGWPYKPNMTRRRLVTVLPRH